MTAGFSARPAGPLVRPRRLRTTPAMRRLVAEQRLHPAELVLPLFVKEGANEATPIGSMPGVVQHSRDTLRKAVAEAAHLGLGGVMLYGIPTHKDAAGSGATDPAGILNVAVSDVRAEIGDSLVVMADLCLDEFTDHGHCGVLAPDGSVDNDATLQRYADMALALGDAGAHLLGTSGMMDGQVGVVRAALDGAGRADVGVLAYAAKYASAFYGPVPRGGRVLARRRPAHLPAGPRERPGGPARGGPRRRRGRGHRHGQAGARLPRRRRGRRGVGDRSGGRLPGVGRVRDGRGRRGAGWIDRERSVLETLTSIRRAGASIVLTYWAAEVAAWLRS